ncbi:hypothetical protein [Streptomyces hydrogenans]|uniref:hypothetical protein n=1 Tax=Streptomyces hydrogenans TaxID=1873719 RepID=UPI00344ABEAF
MITSQNHGALPGRRTVLRDALLTSTAALSTTHLAGCSPSSPRSGTPAASQSFTTGGSNVIRVLLAYFSRPDENYYYGGRTDLKVGNTEVLAEKIADRIACDTYRIQRTPTSKSRHGYKASGCPPGDGSCRTRQDRLDLAGSRRLASVRHRTASRVAKASGLQVPPNARNSFIEPTKSRGLCTSCLVKGFQHSRTCALRHQRKRRCRSLFAVGSGMPERSSSVSSWPSISQTLR